MVSTKQPTTKPQQNKQQKHHQPNHTTNSTFRSRQTHHHTNTHHPGHRHQPPPNRRRLSKPRRVYTTSDFLSPLPMLYVEEEQRPRAPQTRNWSSPRTQRKPGGRGGIRRRGRPSAAQTWRTHTRGGGLERTRSAHAWLRSRSHQEPRAHHSGREERG